MDISELLNFVGRVLVAAYFLWAVWFNFANRGFHLSEFERIGVGGGKILFLVGQVFALGGSVVFLIDAVALYGAALLIIFTLVADMLFHRFWTYPDPEQSTIHKFFLYEHVALIGGILGLASAHL